MYIWSYSAMFTLWIHLIQNLLVDITLHNTLTKIAMTAQNIHMIDLKNNIIITKITYGPVTYIHRGNFLKQPLPDSFFILNQFFRLLNKKMHLFMWKLQIIQ